jgi:hypothetical protein
MGKPPLLSLARFSVTPQEDGSYGVGISTPGETVPMIVGSFSTEAEAEAWIAAQKVSLGKEASARRLKRTGKPTALAKLIGDIATGRVADVAEDKRDPAAVFMGQKGGATGTKSRGKNQRSEFAKRAAAARSEKS